ncbi:MAG: hypothetical protein ACT4OU_05670 [Hyphomicrobium sp.]
MLSVNGAIAGCTGMPLHSSIMIGLFSAAVALLLAAPPSQAAEFKIGASPACKLKLQGPIVAGDATRLEASLAALPSDDGRALTFCLDSPGGDYDEGLRMIWMLLQRTNVATIVDRGAQCFSACAFLFLAGNTQASEDGELAPDRTLDVRGALGFHAPYLETAEANAADVTSETFRRGVNAIAVMLEIDRRELFPRGLLAKALQVGPKYLLYIDTIEKAGVWSIKLKGYRAPAALTDTMLDQACRNKDMWTNFSHSFLGRPADDPNQLHGLRQSDFPDIRGTGKPVPILAGKYRIVLDLFGFEATNHCVVDIYADAKSGLFLSTAMMGVETAPPSPDDFAETVVNRIDDPASMELVTTPLWYAFAPDTKLEGIAAR